MGALQLDSIKPESYSDYKNAFTPRAVQKIYESILEIWPNRQDCVRVLQGQQKGVTALYTGSYEPDAVFKAFTRHSLYVEKILLWDPLLHPGFVREKYNPLIHPEEHRATTIKWTYLWFSLLPWIEAGLVNFVRSPGDLDSREAHEIIGVQRDKFATNPELEQLADQLVDEIANNTPALDRGLKECLFLSHPNGYLLDRLYRGRLDAPWKTEEEFLEFIRQRREKHPYFVEQTLGDSGQFLQESNGLCYEAAKRVCALTNSHIITDNALRWKEVEFDHKFATGQTAVWSPFAKALQGASLKVLDNVGLENALRLRQEQRLEPMRQFFNRVWRGCREATPYSEANIQNLTAELDGKIQEAQTEWEKIDQELLKWTGGAAASLLTSVGVGFVPAAVAAVITGTTGLTLAHWKRRSFKNRFPAGFFLGMNP